MAVVAALLSAQSGVPVPADMVFFGEVGLAGEVRQVPQPDLRLREASKLGFKSAVAPARLKNDKTKPGTDILKLAEIRHVQDLFGLLGEQDPKNTIRKRAGQIA
jgi:DNA repair protein RadA/Sms